MRSRRRPARPPRLGALDIGMYQARLWSLMAVVVLLFGTMLARLGQVQVGERAAYTQAAQTLNTRTIVIPAVRGRILDRSGEPLVDNTSETVVTIDRKVLVESADGGRALLTSIARVLGRSPADLIRRSTLCGTPGAATPPLCWGGSAYQPVPVAYAADPRRALSLAERPDRFPGVRVEAQAVRRYPQVGTVNAAHLLGYLGRSTAQEVADSKGAITDQDLVGRGGLEEQYDRVLRGTPGKVVVAIDPRGVVTREISRQDPVPGRDVVTHLDARVQASAEDALAAGIARARREKHRATAGAAVVLDVRDGGVVAMASLPGYDPRVWTGGISERDYAHLSDPQAGTPLVSRAMTSTFPPASTFKAITLPAALAGGQARLTARYECGSSYRIGDRTFRNFESQAYGRIDLRTAIAVSCDTVFYQFAYRAWLDQGGLPNRSDARDPFVAMARRFGFGRPTGIDLPGESPGRIPDRAWKRQRWEQTRADTCRRARTGYPEVARTDRARAAYLTALAKENCAEGHWFRAGDEANLSIGQGDVQATVLQVATAYAAIADGGHLRAPRVAAALETAGGERTPVPGRSTGTLDLPVGTMPFLHDALRAVVTEGTASGALAGVPSTWPVAGKTGTAEGFGRGDTSWFVSYAPSDAPRYAVAVVVDEGGTGASTAAPIAAQVHQRLADLR